MKKIYYSLLIFLTIGAVFAIGKFIEDRKAFPNNFNEERPLIIEGKKYFISPVGKDSNDGLSENTPFFTIQRGLDLVQPGDGVILSEGVYLQDLVTRRDGTANRLIIITGPKNAVVKGAGEKSRIIEIKHDYYGLKGFTVDGLEGDKDKEKNYRDKLIYIQSDEPLNGVTGSRILEMDLKNAGGECLRMKYFAKGNEVAHNKIVGCGAYDFIFDNNGKNGEGIYIGTAPEQAEDGKNPTEDLDRSDNNWVHHNFIDTQGNECVDIKEGSAHNLIENNECTGQKDKESAGLDSRGNDNTFRQNEVYGNVGAGVRLGGDKKIDGTNNIVVNNFLHDNEGGGIKFQSNPQKQICGNRFANNKKGNLVGEYEEDNENLKNCD